MIQDRPGKATVVQLRELLQQHFPQAQATALAGLPTGIPGIDDPLGGGEPVVVAEDLGAEEVGVVGIVDREALDGEGVIGASEAPDGGGDASSVSGISNRLAEAADIALVGGGKGVGMGEGIDGVIELVLDEFFGLGEL